MDTNTEIRQSTVIGCLAMALAVLAAIVETGIMMAGFIQDGGFPAGAPAQLGVRFTVYLLAAVLIWLTWRGKSSTRWALLVLLGLVGLGSMVVPLASELADGTGLVDALEGPLFATVRLAHIAFVVIGAIALLVAPDGRGVSWATR